MEFVDAKILTIDDEKANIRLLEIILEQAGYRNIYGTTDPREAVSLYNDISPDLVLLDLHMPYVNGVAIMQQLRCQGHPLAPIMVLTADCERTTKYEALKNGAQDFITKPIDEMEVLLRIHNLLTIHFQNILLENKIRERTQELATANLDSLKRLARAAEYRDDVSGLHAERVGVTSASLAYAMGLPQSYLDMILSAAPLHDVGKIGIPDTILRKPGPLSQEEFEIMKQHTVIGAKILSGSASPVLRLAEEIAHYHHERWDGRGYFNLCGEDIPLSGRIVCVADQFDALTHDRPYKEAWSVQEAVSQILSQRGLEFDPQVVDAFLTLPHEELI